MKRSNVLSALVSGMIGAAIVALIVLFGVGLFIASGRAALYAPVITRATQSPTASPATPEGGSVEGATPVTADHRVTVITATLDPSALPAVAGGSLSVTFEAAQISGDILFAPPVLTTASLGDRELTACPELVEGATPESLRAARLAMLAAITDGKATATLTFADVPPELAPSTGSGQALSLPKGGTLIFNPSSQPGNIVDPRIEVAVEWGK